MRRELVPSSAIHATPTCDGDSISTQESVVDSEANPTQLYLRLNYRLWDMALTSLQTKPHEAAIWISRNEQKALPLHIACESTTCPPDVISALLQAYPVALACGTVPRGDLPLHLACGNQGLVKNQQAMLNLVNMFPEALKRMNINNLTPLDILRLLPKKSRSVKELIAEWHLKVVTDSQDTEYELQRDDDESHSVAKASVVTPQLDNRTSKTRGKINRETSKAAVEASPTTTMTDLSTGDDGFAIRLNKMRLEQIETLPEEQQRVDLPFRPSESPASIKHELSSPTEDHLRLRTAAAIMAEEDDESIHDAKMEAALVSPPYLQRNLSPGSAPPQVFFSEQGYSDESDYVIPPRSSMASNLKLSKTVKENELLRKKLEKLSEETAMLRSSELDNTALIADLKQSVEKERNFNKTHLKQYELSIAKLEDALHQEGRKLQTKRENDLSNAKRISQLENCLAGKRADLSTMKVALRDEALSKESLQDELSDLERHTRSLVSELETKSSAVEQLMSQLEDISKEVEAHKEIDLANKEHIKELTTNLNQKDIQLRSMTDTVAAGDGKVERLESLNAALKTKTTDVKNLLKSNTETFKATIANLERELKRKEEQEIGAKAKINELEHVVDGKDAQLKTLQQEQIALETKCESLCQKELVAEKTAQELESAKNEIGQLNLRLSEKDEDILSKSKMIASLQSEAVGSTKKLEETERRLDALYTELVSQQRRETDLEKKNKEMQQRIDEFDEEHRSKTIKLRVLKTAVESYKTELEQFATKKSADQKLMGENATKLLELQENYGVVKVNLSEMTAKFEATELREKEAIMKLNESQQTVRKTTQELEVLKAKQLATQAQVTELEFDLDEKRRKLGKLEDEHAEVLENIDQLEAKHKRLLEVHAEKVKSEGKLQSEHDKTKDYYRLQASLVEDMEATLSDLRAKYADVSDEYEQVKCIAEKRDHMDKTKEQEHQRALDRSARQVTELESQINELTRTKTIDQKKIGELESEVKNLREWYAVTLERVSELETTGKAETIASQDLERLQGIIQSMKKEAIISEETIQVLKDANSAISQERANLQQVVESSAKDASKNLAVANENESNITDLTEQLLQSQTNNIKLEAKTQKNESKWKSKLAEMTKKLSMVNANCDDLTEELRGTVVELDETRTLLSASQSNERKMQDRLLSYQEKAVRLETALTELRSTVEEQSGVVTSKVAISDTIENERVQLKKQVEHITGELDEAKAQIDSLLQQIDHLAREKSQFEELAKSAVVKAESLDAIIETMKHNKEEIVDYETEWPEEQRKLVEDIDRLTAALNNSTQRCEETQKLLNKLIIADTDEVVAVLQQSVVKAQAELRDERKESCRLEEVNKSYQVEVGRLLKMNTYFQAEKEEMKVAMAQNQCMIRELQQYKEEYEKQSMESGVKLLGMLKRFSADDEMSDLIREKQELQNAYQAAEEDNVANVANVEYFLQNIQLLETHVQDLTTSHHLLLEQDRINRDTIDRQKKRIATLRDNKSQYTYDTDEDQVFSDEDDMLNDLTFDWDTQIMDLLRTYGATTLVGTSDNSLLQKASNRREMRENLKKQVTDTIANQSSQITALKELVAAEKSRAEEEIGRLESSISTVKMENHVLKTAGREQSERSSKTQARLKAENVALKHAMEKLTQQTADHQRKIRRLAAKQAAWARKRPAMSGQGSVASSVTSVASTNVSHNDIDRGQPDDDDKEGETKSGTTNSNDEEIASLKDESANGETGVAESRDDAQPCSYA